MGDADRDGELLRALWGSQSSASAGVLGSANPTSEEQKNGSNYCGFINNFAYRDYLLKVDDDDDGTLMLLSSPFKVQLDL